MTCAKVRVTCELVCPDGSIFFGSNDCIAPQPVCPRAPGEDYTKCREVCVQPAHAEMIALSQAGEAARGATLHVWHKRICDECLRAARLAGVKRVWLRPQGLKIEIRSDTMETGNLPDAARKPA